MMLVFDAKSKREAHLHVPTQHFNRDEIRVVLSNVGLRYAGLDSLLTTQTEFEDYSASGGDAAALNRRIPTPLRDSIKVT